MSEIQVANRAPGNFSMSISGELPEPPAPQDLESRLRDALNASLAASLRPLAVGLGVLYSSLSVLHLLLTPAPTGIMLGVASGVAACAFLGFSLLRISSAISPRLAHPVGAGMAALVLVECLAHLALGQDPRVTIYFMLLALGAGFFALSSAWLAGVLAATLAGWMVVVGRIGFSAAWWQFALALLSALALAAMIHIVRVRTLRRLEGLRLTDEWLKAQLRAALESAEQARQAEAASKRELERAYEALRQSETQARALLEAIPDLILKLRRDGAVIDFRGSHLSEAFGAVPETGGVRLEQLFSEAPTATMLAAVERALATGEIQTVEFEQTRRGSTRCLESRLVRNGPDEVLAIVRDITQRRQAEAERRLMERKLQETQKLESLGVLAGGIAHDFNNLLTTILGNASLLRQETPPGSPQRSQLAAIERASQQAAGLCQQMLAYAGQGELAVRRIELNALITEMTDLLRSSVGKQAQLQFQLGEHLPALEADPSQVRQVVLNLVVNGAEAIGEGAGAVTIRTGHLQADRDYLARCAVSADAVPGHYVFIEVADTGAGMNRETQGRVFDPFFTTKFVGRGLGLAAVQGIVRAHRGAIAVQSEPGRGSLFRVLLPAVSGPAPLAAPGAPAAPEWRGRGTVLVVDDEEDVRKVAGRLLESLGFGVLGAPDGKEAIETFQVLGDRITAVLLDFVMPQVNGAEVFAELRRLRPDARIIVASGYTEREIARLFPAPGPAAFLQKPYRRDELRETFRAVLETQG